MSVAQSGLLTYNAALNRTAYQSSVYRGYNASLANDGSRDTRSWTDGTSRCSMSMRDTNPWWAVDLGRPTTIYRVIFTNRGDSGGM